MAQNDVEIPNGIAERTINGPSNMKGEYEGPVAPCKDDELRLIFLL